MAYIFAQFKALLYRNFLIKKSQWITTLFELCLPCLIFLVLVLVKQLVDVEYHDASYHLDMTNTFTQTGNFLLLPKILDMRQRIIALYPEDKVTPVVDYLTKNHFNSSYLKVFKDEGEFKDYVGDADYGNRVDFPGVHLAVQIDDLVGPDYQYSLRFNTSRGVLSLPNTFFPAYSLNDKSYQESWTKYDALGFTFFQNIIDTYILNKEEVFQWDDSTPYTPMTIDQAVKITHQPFPTLRYDDDNFTTIAGSSLGFVLVLAYVWLVSRIISVIVAEKESRMKALMKLMGMQETPIMLSWFVTYVVIFVIASILICASSFFDFYYNSNIFLIFFIYVIFGLCVYANAYLISAFFDHAKPASTFGAIIFILTFFSSFLVQDEIVGGDARIAVCIIPTSCFSQLNLAIANLESRSAGLNWNTVLETVDGFPIYQGILMLIFDFFLYFILGIYFNQIIPGEYLIAKPWYFPFSIEFWFGSAKKPNYGIFSSCCGCYRQKHSKNRKKISSSSLSSPKLNNINTNPGDEKYTKLIDPREEEQYEYEDYYQQEQQQHKYNDEIMSQFAPFDPTTANEGVDTKIQPHNVDDHTKPIMSIRNLRKTYPSDAESIFSFLTCCYSSRQTKKEDFVAVDGLTVDLYPNSVVTLLAENGGGKTTTFSMLSGMIQRTSGNALINGVTLDDPEDLYQQQGVVFQHDVLHPELTVYEMMKLFCAVKRVKGTAEEQDEQIKNVLDKVGLGPKGDNKMNVLCSQLSGGQKKKVSCSIAILNDSPIVYLDEPTSSVDIASQHALRDVILANREGRVFIYTTHTMSEAQAISDNIMIMAAGKLLAAGSQNYLQEAFDFGYTLDINKNTDDHDDNNNNTNNNLIPKKTNNKNDGLNQQDNKPAVFPQTVDGEKIYNYLTTRYPFVSLLNDINGQMSFQMPSRYTKQFPQLLNDLEQQKTNLSIATYGISATTLSTIFLSVISGKTREEVHRQEEEQQQNDDNNNNNNDDDNVNIDLTTDDLAWDQYFSTMTEMSFTSIFFIHWRALFKKRFQDFLRNRKQQLWVLVYPAIVLLLGLLCLLWSVSIIGQPPTRGMRPNGLWPDGNIFELANNVDDVNNVMMWGVNKNNDNNENNFNSFFTPRHQDNVNAFVVNTQNFFERQQQQEMLSRRGELPNVDGAVYDVEDALFIEKNKNLSLFSSSNYYSSYLNNQDLIHPSETTTTSSPFLLPNTTIENIQTFYTSLKQTNTDLFNYEMLSTNATTPIQSLFDMQEYLNNTALDRDYNKVRFGALLVNDFPSFPYHINLVHPNPNIINTTVFFNTTALDALPIFRNYLSNTFLRMKQQQQHDNQQNDDNNNEFENNNQLKNKDKLPRITTNHYPLPKTKRQLTFTTSTIAFIVAIAAAFIPASYASFLVYEKHALKFTHLQQVSGVSNLAYFVSTFTWDLVNFLPAYFLFLIILLPFNFEVIMNVEGFTIINITFWLWIIASCPFTYCLTYLFENYINAQNTILLFNFIFSVVLLILSISLTMINSTREVNKVLRFFYRLVPPYAFVDVWAMIAVKENIYSKDASLFEGVICGWSMIFLVFDFVIYTILLILIEHMRSNNSLTAFKRKLCCNNNNNNKNHDNNNNDLDAFENTTSLLLPGHEHYQPSPLTTPNPNGNPYNHDDPLHDVWNLRWNVQTNPDMNDPHKYPIVTRNLRKVHPPPKNSATPLVAVNSLDLAVKRGTCTAIVGPNGAGKSSYVKLLTSEEYPTSGDTLIDGHSILTESEIIRHCLGYIPQHNALLPTLTIREHMELFAGIKCIPEDCKEQYITFLMKKLQMEHLQHRQVASLSGGWKRKTQLVCALLGQPAVLLIDELSAGIDLQSRQTLIHLLSTTMKNRSTILISHNLEECEALADNVAVITSGKLDAYGTNLHLKQQCGKGLQVEIRCVSDEPSVVNNVKTWFQQQFPLDLVVIEEYRKTLKYYISKKYSIAHIFEVMENAKDNNNHHNHNQQQQHLGMESYTISEPTLESLFVKMVEKDDLRRSKNNWQRA